MNLIQAWISDLRHTLDAEMPLIHAVRVGVFYTAAQLSTGHVGVAFTPRDLADTVCCPKTAAAAPPSGRMVGRHAWDLAEYALSPSALRRSVGVAVLNALSALAVSRHGIPGGQFKRGVDALTAAEVGRDDRVTMVGAFIPFIKALKGQVIALSVVDKHPQALKPEEMEYWVSPEGANAALSRATVVIISASALVEGEIDGLLEAAAGARKVILAGPTAPLWPRPFFERGVDILGGIEVRDAARLLALVSEGGSGAFFFGHAAEKVSIIKEPPLRADVRAAAKTTL